jgi:HSP20 family molecular chaperone IbpA
VGVMHLSVILTGMLDIKITKRMSRPLNIFGIPTEKKKIQTLKQGRYVIPRRIDLNNNNDNKKYVKGILHVFLKKMYSTTKGYQIFYLSNYCKIKLL